jgi:hypothetical protein
MVTPWAGSQNAVGRYGGSRALAESRAAAAFFTQPSARRFRRKLRSDEDDLVQCLR